MSQFIYVLFLFGGIFGFWYLQQKRLKDQGGVAGVLAKADRTAFGLAEGESIAKRWDAMFYMGKLVPETMLSMGEHVSNFLSNTTVRGRHIRIGLTTTNRIVFSMEPSDSNDRPDTFDAMSDHSAGFSRGFRPVAVITASSAPRVMLGERIFGGHDAWPSTVKNAPAANMDPQNWQAATRKMTVARLENMPDGRDWTLWIDPEALQFLASFGRGDAATSALHA